MSQGILGKFDYGQSISQTEVKILSLRMEVMIFTESIFNPFTKNLSQQTLHRPLIQHSTFQNEII